MIDSFCWTQSFIYINLDRNVVVNLAQAVTENTKVPSNAPDQPGQFFQGSKFRLPGFIGSDSTAMKEIERIFDMACEGTTLSFAQGMKSYWNAKLIDTMLL